MARRCEFGDQFKPVSLVIISWQYCLTETVPLLIDLLPANCTLMFEWVTLQMAQFHISAMGRFG